MAPARLPDRQVIQYGHIIDNLGRKSKICLRGNRGIIHYEIDGIVRIKGYNILPPIREVIRIKAREANNPKYSILQYGVFNYVVIVPAQTSDISEYLGSGAIKGIGPEIARRIVNKFGLQTIDIIENDIDRLKEVEGARP